MVYEGVSEKRYGVVEAEAHTATAAQSIDQSIKGSMRWSKDELKYRLNEIWTSHSIDDTSKPQNEAASKASGLTPPMWLWRRILL